MTETAKGPEFQREKGPCRLDKSPKVRLEVSFEKGDKDLAREGAKGSR